MKISKIRQSVIDWNNRFPLDRWWRRKYNVPFLSQAHRESTFYSHYFDYYEEVVYKELQEEYAKNKEQDKGKNDYTPMSNNWWKGLESTAKEIDDWFNSGILD
jgi:hypothetical protein